MHGFDTRGRARRGGRLAMLAVAAAVTLALAACTNPPTDGSGQAGGAAVPTTGSSAAPPLASVPPASSSAAELAVITAPDGRRVNPGKPVTVAIRNGQLTGVTMLTPTGRKVRGTMASDRTSWHTTEDLGYAKTYRLSATGRDGSGAAVTKTAEVTTVTPDNQTMPYLQRIGGYPLTGGATYGVGIVPVVHFDEPISNQAAAERSLTITTTPQVDGSWYWTDDQNVHWRPEHYWPSGTKVTVSADVYGVHMGHGLYGQSDVSRSFTIGRKQVTVAYDTAPKSVNKVRVYNSAGKAIRTMNTSMGRHSGVTVNGTYINFYTLDGTYTVLGHEQPARMCSASYGLPADVDGGYACEDIYNATKISIDGIYLHELLTTVYSQNNGEDVSHGCLNLNGPNSKWFFNHSMIGDPVEIHGAKHAPTLQVWQGGDWTVPWSTWVKGSALG